MKYRRTMSVERNSMDLETGKFPALLFTDGEASDGHILNIAGGEIPARMPMFLDHWHAAEDVASTLR